MSRKRAPRTTDSFTVNENSEIGADVDLETEDVRLADGTRLTDDTVVELVREVRAKAGGRPSLTGAGKRSPQVAFRVPETIRAKADRAAELEGVTVSKLARRALEEYLAKH